MTDTWLWPDIRKALENSKRYILMVYLPLSMIYGIATFLPDHLGPSRMDMSGVGATVEYLILGLALAVAIFLPWVDIGLFRQMSAPDAIGIEQSLRAPPYWRFVFRMLLAGILTVMIVGLLLALAYGLMEDRSATVLLYRSPYLGFVETGLGHFAQFLLTTFSLSLVSIAIGHRMSFIEGIKLFWPHMLQAFAIMLGFYVVVFTLEFVAERILVDGVSWLALAAAISGFAQVIPNLIGAALLVAIYQRVKGSAHDDAQAAVFE